MPVFPCADELISFTCIHFKNNADWQHLPHGFLTNQSVYTFYVSALFSCYAVFNNKFERKGQYACVWGTLVPYRFQYIPSKYVSVEIQFAAIKFEPKSS